MPTVVVPTSGYKVSVASVPGRVTLTVGESYCRHRAALMPEEVTALVRAAASGAPASIATPNGVAVTLGHPHPDRVLLALDPSGYPRCESDFCRRTVGKLLEALELHTRDALQAGGTD